MLHRIAGALVCLCTITFTITLSVDAIAQSGGNNNEMPVFTGFVPMSELHLQEGFLRPFDNVGVFGWRGLVLLNDSKLHFTGPVIETPLYFLGFGVVPRQIYGGTDTVRPEGMTPLFDGETLNGWTVRGTADASVVDGVIRLTNGNGSLESDGKYGDFVLQLEYYTPVRPPGQGVNSGVFFRCIPGETMNGYECQILNSPSQRDFNNSMGGISATGGIHNRQTARNVGPKDGEWNYLTIAARGNRMAIWVNGIQVINWTDERAPHNNPRNGSRVEPGTIQFQGHDPDTEILFRNIRIREL